MAVSSAIWVAIVALLVWIVLERAGPATEVQYHVVDDISVSSPMTGQYAVNTKLRDGIRPLAPGRFHFAETVTVDNEGAILGTTHTGEIFRITMHPDGQELYEVWATVGGSLLGVEVGPDGRVWVADATRGLLSVDPETRQATIHSTHATLPSGTLSLILFADDVTLTSDGQVIFSDATALPPMRDTKGNYDFLSSTVLDFMTGHPTGRLLVYDPNTRVTRVLLDNLWFANGVALSQDESFILVAESMRYRIIRYWLKGPKTGSHDVFIDRLPGCPDGVSTAPDGGFWIAIGTPDPPLASFLAGHRALRAFMARLGKAVQLDIIPWGIVVKISAEGEVIDCLHDPNGKKVRAITSVKQHGDQLYFGTVGNNFVPVFSLNAEK